MSASTPDDLQFAKAEPAAYTPDSDASALACAECTQPIAQYYFEANGRVLCASCKGKIERALAGEGTSRTGRITRALVFGFGAALVGAAIWFGVAVAFNLEFGLIAILIGWMVGRAVRAGSAGRGGRRYQVAAALLTYLSVAMSYGALGIREIVKGNGATVVADSAATTTTANAPARDAAASATATSATPPAADAAGAGAGTDAATDSTGAAASGSPSLGVALLFTFGFMFVLPIIANLSSMPSGIIGLGILIFGIMQAWNMNAPATVAFTGPHRLTRPDDADPSPAASAG